MKLKKSRIDTHEEFTFPAPTKTILADESAIPLPLVGEDGARGDITHAIAAN